MVYCWKGDMDLYLVECLEDYYSRINCWEWFCEWSLVITCKVQLQETFVYSIYLLVPLLMNVYIAEQTSIYTIMTSPNKNHKYKIFDDIVESLYFYV